MIFSASYTDLLPGKSAPILYQGDMDECFLSMSNAGFKGVELHIDSPASIEREKLAYLLSGHGLCLTSLGTGLSYSRDALSLSAPEESIRLSAVKRVCEYIDLASHFPGCIVIIGLIRGRVGSLEPCTYKDRLLSSLRICADYAEAHEVCLVMELINRYEADFLNRVSEGLSFLNELGHPSVRLHLDTFHMNIEEQSPVKAILKAGKQLGHIHFADSDRHYPGHAHFPFRESLAALKKINYCGAIAMECLPLPSTETAAAHTISSLSKSIC